MESQFDSEIGCESGVTSLHLASECGHARIVELLIENGADVNVVDSYTGDTPV